MFRVGRARDFGAGFEKKKKKNSAIRTVHVCCDILWFEVLVLGAQQQHTSSSHTTLCIATCVAHVAACHPAFGLQTSLGDGTGLDVQYAECFSLFIFLSFFSFFSALPHCFGWLTRRET